MRWLVEVSHVGDTAASERYCIEAKRWQAALQEARRLRGDAGALPKLTIELLDQGYRAVDPALKVRYVVTEASAGTPLTEGAQALLTTYPPPAVAESQAPPSAPLSVRPMAPLAALVQSSASAPPPAAAVPAVPLASSLPPQKNLSSQPSGGPLVAQVIRQREERAMESNPIEYRELALAVKSGASREDIGTLLETRLEEIRAGLGAAHKRYVQIAVFDHMFVKRPVRPPLATLVWKDWRGDPVLSFPGFGEEKRVGSEPPASSALSTRAPSWSGSAARSVSAAPLGPLPQNLGGASVAPPRPHHAATTLVSAIAVPSDAPRPAASVIPARVVSVGPGAAQPAPAPLAAPVAAPATPAASAAPALGAVLTPAQGATGVSDTLQSASPPSAPGLDLEVEEGEPISLPSDAISAQSPPPAPPEEAVSSQAVRGAEAALVAEQPVSETPLALTRRSEQPGRRSDPPVTPVPVRRRSDPSMPRRRTPSEDLIGDLFENIHELSFMVDLVSGADFVMRVLSDMIPCEAIVVHAFDLGRREFVVIRARGPQAQKALMHRTPDANPIVREVMRRRSLISNGASPTRSGAFEKLGTDPQLVLSAAVRQGGRYLGLIELANPVGGTPFHEGEASALEYVCEQFAEFVASRPIVLDEDVVLGR